MQNIALFIDLDGTLITTRSGKKYPLHSEDWKFIPESLDAIQHYAKKGHTIIILSNQLGIEEGYVLEKAFIAKMENICKVLEKLLKLPSKSVLYNYNNKSNYYTMPNAGMVHELAIDYELELHNCLMIGSNPDTSLLASRLGIAYMSIVDVINSDWSSR